MWHFQEGLCAFNLLVTSIAPLNFTNLQPPDAPHPDLRGIQEPAFQFLSTSFSILQSKHLILQNIRQKYKATATRFIRTDLDQSSQHLRNPWTSYLFLPFIEVVPFLEQESPKRCVNPYDCAQDAIHNVQCVCLSQSFLCFVPKAPPCRAPPTLLADVPCLGTD